MSQAGFEVDYSAFENFVTVLRNSESEADDVNKAFDSLATSITEEAWPGGNPAKDAEDPMCRESP